MTYLIDSDYVEQAESDSSSGSEVIRLVSDLCFINCILDTAVVESGTKAEEAKKLVEHVSQIRVRPHMTVLSPGFSVIEQLQRSRRIKVALIEAISQKMLEQETMESTQEY